MSGLGPSVYVPSASSGRSLVFMLDDAACYGACSFLEGVPSSLRTLHVCAARSILYNPSDREQEARNRGVLLNQVTTLAAALSQVQLGPSWLQVYPRRLDMSWTEDP